MRTDSDLAEAEVRLDAALALARVGDFVAARALAETQVNAFPDELTVLRKAGAVLRACGDHAAALVLFRRALAAQQIDIASEYSALGETEEALRWFRQAIVSHPDHAAAYLAAAKLERELGRSWNGLLLLESLYERLPQDVESNAVRTEFLRHHAEHPEVAREIGSETNDWTVHFRHMRALTEIGDFRSVLAHGGRLTSATGSDLAFHAAVFSGHARLALTVDSVRSAAKAAAMERSPSWLDTERLAIRLRHAISDRVPLSMIRLGDGEARFLALSDPWARGVISEYEAKCIVSVIWRNWFGQPIDAVDPVDLAVLSREFTGALADADILGVSTAQRYERDTFHRGYLALLERAVDKVMADRPGVSLTHAFANILLHRRSPFYAELLSGLDFLGCISPHPGLAARLAQYHGIAEYREYLVPGEARLPDAAQGRAQGPHFPDRFHAIMAELRVPRPGAVFLVAAGLLGKIYCHRIRQLGGIAIDVGSVVDAWMGFATRPGLYHEPETWVLPQ